MKLLLMIIAACTAGTGFAASAAQSGTQLRVGITIRNACTIVSRADGVRTSPDCGGPIVSTLRGLAAGAVPTGTDGDAASALAVRRTGEPGRPQRIVVEF